METSGIGRNMRCMRCMIDGRGHHVWSCKEIGDHGHHADIGLSLHHCKANMRHGSDVVGPCGCRIMVMGVKQRHFEGRVSA